MSFMKSLSSLFSSGPGPRAVSPEEAAKLVEEGKAVLVDVREPDEWAETGVAKPAQLISLGNLQGPEGQDLIEKNKGKEILCYCRSGGRSAAAARALAQKGLRTGNVGGFSDWKAAGLPVRKI
jgi:rhodanese-related sulfurtransferase